jgi:hypothetical protein
MAHWRHSGGLSEWPLPTPLRKFGSEFSMKGVDPDCSLIGISKSSILETDVWAGVTVLSGVGFRSPHNGCQG